MSRKRLLLFILLPLFTLVVLACMTTTPTALPGLRETYVYQTVNAQLTHIAFDNLVAQLTQIAQVTPTHILPTATLQPTSTNTSLPTNTPIPSTPTKTPIPPTPTATPIPCNWAGFVSDVSVPDGTSFYAQDTFVKTWRFQNIGTCTWTKDYDLVFVRGNAMNAPAVVPLGIKVHPGEIVDVSLMQTTPIKTGDYIGFWELRSNNGVLFGIGDDAQTPFWIKIRALGKRPNLDKNNPLDLVHNYKAAIWRNSEGALPIPGLFDDIINGSISTLDKPHIESPKAEGRVVNKPAIVMIPENGKGGKIVGLYPGIQILAGDHFVSRIGCLYNNPDCNVTIRLKYIIDGSNPVELGAWKKKYDGRMITINIDLTPLADKKVQFMLVVENNGDSKDDSIFWFDTKITR